MKQLCIRLDEETYSKIKERSNHKALGMSEYIRRLVELGLRIEEMSEKKSGEGKDKDEPFSDLGSSKSLWEKQLIWSLETRFLIRILLDKLINGKADVDEKLLYESKIRAEHFVSGLLNQEIKEN